MKLKNLMEEVVFNVMDDYLQKEEMCKCDRCKMDIAGIALNQLPSKYVVTEKGEAYGKTDIIDIQKNVDVITAIMAGITRVKANPSHK